MKELIVNLFLAIIVQLLSLIACRPFPVPAQIQDYLVTFQDAFGKTSKIDIAFVTNWEVGEVSAG